MKIYSQKKKILIPILLLACGAPALLAQAVPIAPKIETKKWEGGSSVSIIFPDNYSGSVETSCVNNVCTSTTTSFTEKDKKDMLKKMEKQRKEMELFWKKQQELFDQLWKQSMSVWSLGN